MQFRCVNCGGNVVYDPKVRAMVCMSCNSKNSEEVVSQQDSYVCSTCGGALPVNEFTSAVKCEFCGSYSIVDEKIQYPYGPDMILPFRYTKEQATNLLRTEFKDRLFCPSDFLSERTLENLEGDYVPFWLYSYHTHAVWDGIGTKVRSWVIGDTEYVETSRYKVYRELNIEFQQVPVDASLPMPDDIMDIMEPYQYADMAAFEPKYMSGYHAETYNMPPDQLEPRALKKVNQDTESWMASTMAGYTSRTATAHNNTHTPAARELAMLPVWKYTYRYHGRNYDYYINGQTGKLYGSMPRSLGKIWVYGGSLFATIALFLFALKLLAEVI